VWTGKWKQLKMSDIQTGEDMQRMMRHHPVFMYFHMKLGLRMQIRENGEDVVDAMADIALGLRDLMRCIRTATLHLTMFLFYPIAKAVALIRVRKLMLKANPADISVGRHEEA